MADSNQPQTAFKLEDIGLPGMSGKSQGGIDVNNFTVRYCKACLDEPADVQLLEEIETKGLRGDDIIVLNKEKYTFMEKFFIVITYLERTN